jgi:hypothetical protein
MMILQTIRAEAPAAELSRALGGRRSGCGWGGALSRTRRSPAFRPSRPRIWYGNLDQLTLPPVVEEIVLVADGDHMGLAAAHRAAQRYGATGRRVRLVELPRGMDANDVLRREASVA